MHVGYCETQKAFRLWDKVSRKLRISRDVLFNEENICPIETRIFNLYDLPKANSEIGTPKTENEERTQPTPVEMFKNFVLRAAI